LAASFPFLISFTFLLMKQRNAMVTTRGSSLQMDFLLQLVMGYGTMERHVIEDTSSGASVAQIDRARVES
jgi:hypothetical protein